MFRTLLPLIAVAAVTSLQPTAVLGRQANAPVPSKPAAVATVNINTASATEIEALPGIGAKTAALIVEYRQKNGPFKKIEELMNVRGIGEKNFLKLKDHITVASPKSEAQAR